MQPNQVRGRESRAAGEVFEVGAVVAGGQVDGTGRGLVARRRRAPQDILDLAVGDALRIEQHEQRARGGDRLEEPRRTVPRKGRRQDSGEPVRRRIGQIRMRGEDGAVGEVAHLHPLRLPWLRGGDAVLKIVVGNKNYSSWSLRAWLLVK